LGIKVATLFSFLTAISIYGYYSPGNCRSNRGTLPHQAAQDEKQKS
jgi:hypothetical protein